MKKRLLILAPALLLGLSSFSITVKDGKKEQQSVVQQNQTIYESVKKELASFLEVIPVDLEKEHGFNDRSEFAKALPGSIYRIVGVDAEGKPFETNLYNVLVTVNGEYRAILTVSHANGQYEIEAIGATLLAKELQLIEKENPITVNQERVVLNVYKKSAGFVTYQDVNSAIENADLIPLASAKAGMAVSETNRTVKPTYKLSEAVEALQLK
jgi:ABC-type Na+ efflux pump permease subunit